MVSAERNGRTVGACGYHASVLRSPNDHSLDSAQLIGVAGYRMTQSPGTDHRTSW